MPEFTADLWDARSEELMSCDVQFRSFEAIRSFARPVRTVSCHEDNQLVKHLLNSPGDGSVLVVDGGGPLHSALVGDQIGAAALRGVGDGYDFAMARPRLYSDPVCGESRELRLFTGERDSPVGLYLSHFGDRP